MSERVREGRGEERERDREKEKRVLKKTETCTHHKILFRS